MATESSSSFSFVIYAVGSSETDFIIPAAILTLFEFGVAIGDQFTLYRVDASGTKSTLVEGDGDWSAISSSLIRLTTAISDGTLELRRETLKADAYVNFQTADNIGADELDFSKYHNFMLAQESYDRAQRALPMGTDGHWDAEDQKVRRVLAGTLGTDAANIAQLAAADLGGLSAGLNTPFTYLRTGNGTVMGPGNAVDLADDIYLVSGEAADVDGNVMQEEELFVTVNGVVWKTTIYNLVGTMFSFVGFTPGVSDDVQVRWLPGTIVAAFEDDTVGTNSLVDRSVTGPKVALDAILGEHVADDELDSEHYKALSIDAEHLAANSVPTSKIPDANITAPKLAPNILGGSYTARIGRLCDKLSDVNHYRNTEASLICAYISLNTPNGSPIDLQIEIALDNGSGAPGTFSTIFTTQYPGSGSRHLIEVVIPIPVGSWVRLHDPGNKSSTNNGSNDGFNVESWTDFIYGV